MDEIVPPRYHPPQKKKKIKGYLKPEHMTLLGNNRVFADSQDEIILGLGWALCPVIDVLIRKGEDREKVMSRHRQRLESCSYKTRNASSHQKL